MKRDQFKFDEAHKTAEHYTNIRGEKAYKGTKQLRDTQTFGSNFQCMFLLYANCLWLAFLDKWCWNVLGTLNV